MSLIPFTDTVKIYVLKNENAVQVNFRITDVCVVSKRFTLDEFKTIIEGWREGISGLETEDSGRIWWEHRDCGPRPVCEPANFVAISIQGWHWRLTVGQMEIIEKEYHKQLVKINHWD